MSSYPFMRKLSNTIYILPYGLIKNISKILRAWHINIIKCQPYKLVGTLF